MEGDKVKKQRKSVIIDIAKNGSPEDKLWLLSVVDPRVRILTAAIKEEKTEESIRENV